MSTVTVQVEGDTETVVVSSEAVQVVTVQTEGPRGPTGPLAPLLGIISIIGTPGTGEVPLEVQFGEALQIGENLEGWRIVSKIEATDTSVGRVYLNDVETATFTWGPGETVAVLGGGIIDIAPTDWVKIELPAPADATLAGISIRVYATRV